MTTAENHRAVPFHAAIIIAGLCWMPVSSQNATASPSDAEDGQHRFRLVAAESVFGVEAANGFDLGISPEPTATASAKTAPPGEADCAGARIELPGSVLNRDAQPPPDAGQPPTSPADGVDKDRTPEKPYGWKQLRFDLDYLARKPAHLDAREVRASLAVAGTTGLLYVFRKDIQEAWHDNSSQSRSDFLNSARVMGDAAFAPTVALGAYLASFLTHNDREKETAQLVLESMALSGLGATVGQFVLATERPEDGDAIYFFRTGGHGVSGDVAFAASVIPPLRRQYLRVRPGDGTGRRILKHSLSALLYSGMVFTALQRIDADKHWAPDVFLGMAVGLGVGRTLGQAHDHAEQQRSRLAFRMLPGGVAVTWTLNLDPR